MNLICPSMIPEQTLILKNKLKLQPVRCIDKQDFSPTTRNLSIELTTKSQLPQYKSTQNCQTTPTQSQTDSTTTPTSSNICMQKSMNLNQTAKESVGTKTTFDLLASFSHHSSRILKRFLSFFTNWNYLLSKTTFSRNTKIFFTSPRSFSHLWLEPKPHKSSSTTHSIQQIISHGSHPNFYSSKKF